MEEIGPYDESMVRNQDDEYNYRIRKMGGRLLLASDVRSRYYSRAGVGSLWRQYFGYGFWKSRVLRKHPRQMRARQFVPGAFVLCVLVGLIFSPFSRRVRAMLIGTLLAYAGASGYASASLASRAGWSHFLGYHWLSVLYTSATAPVSGSAFWSREEQFRTSRPRDSGIHERHLPAIRKARSGRL